MLYITFAATQAYAATLDQQLGDARWQIAALEGKNAKLQQEVQKLQEKLRDRNQRRWDPFEDYDL
jgi:chaperonin cofactor prefoldin